MTMRIVPMRRIVRGGRVSSGEEVDAGVPPGESPGVRRANARGATLVLSGIPNDATIEPEFATSFLPVPDGIGGTTIGLSVDSGRQALEMAGLDRGEIQDSRRIKGGGAKGTVNKREALSQLERVSRQ